MKYHCDVCNYDTDDRTYFYHHKKTQRHIKNSNKDNESDKIIQKATFYDIIISNTKFCDVFFEIWRPLKGCDI